MRIFVKFPSFLVISFSNIYFKYRSVKQKNSNTVKYYQRKSTLAYFSPALNDLANLVTVFIIHFAAPRSTLGHRQQHGLSHPMLLAHYIASLAGRSPRAS